MGNFAQEAAASALAAGGGVLPVAAGGRKSGSPVSCATASNVVGRAHLFCLGLAGDLTLKLLIEGEDCSLGDVVDVAGTASASHELGAGLRELGAKEGGWTSCIGCVGGLWGLEGVACSSSSGVHVGAGVWVRLSYLVGRHCDESEFFFCFGGD